MHLQALLVAAAPHAGGAAWWDPPGLGGRWSGTQHCPGWELATGTHEETDLGDTGHPEQPGPADFRGRARE